MVCCRSTGTIGKPGWTDCGLLQIYRDDRETRVNRLWSAADLQGNQGEQTVVCCRSTGTIGKPGGTDCGLLQIYRETRGNRLWSAADLQGRQGNQGEQTVVQVIMICRTAWRLPCKSCCRSTRWWWWWWRLWWWRWWRWWWWWWWWQWWLWWWLAGLFSVCLARAAADLPDGGPQGRQRNQGEQTVAQILWTTGDPGPPPQHQVSPLSLCFLPHLHILTWKIIYCRTLTALDWLLRAVSVSQTENELFCFNSWCPIPHVPGELRVMNSTIEHSLKYFVWSLSLRT